MQLAQFASSRSIRTTVLFLSCSSQRGSRRCVCVPVSVNVCNNRACARVRVFFGPAGMRLGDSWDGWIVRRQQAGNEAWQLPWLRARSNHTVPAGIPASTWYLPCAELIHPDSPTGSPRFYERRGRCMRGAESTARPSRLSLGRLLFRATHMAQPRPDDKTTRRYGAIPDHLELWPPHICWQPR